MISGTTRARNASADVRPPGSPDLHGESCASWHKFGVMNEKFGVVAALASAGARRVKSTTFCAHAGLSMIEWKYTNGL